MKIDIMGDPHLGKTFVHGVPLHRRGEREEMVWRDFEANLRATDADLHVCLGDLFDRAIVPFNVILRAADLYLSTAAQKPSTRFVILRGNHDVQKLLEKASAFDLFARLVASAPNITIVTDAVMIEGYLFVGYDPVTPLADRITDAFAGARAAFFHAETETFGNDFNLIPTAKLAALGITQVYNGHEHKAARITRDGVEIEIVGSLQPYAHGEESDDRLYVTLTLDALETAGDLMGKCVRVLLQPGEVLDREIDALQVTVKRESEAVEEQTVTLDGFDIDVLFWQAFAEAGVGDALTETMIERFHERRLTAEG